MPLIQRELLIEQVKKEVETQVVNSSTTLVDDDTLKLKLRANSQYIIKGLLAFESPVAAAFKWTFKDITDMKEGRIGDTANVQAPTFGNTASIPGGATKGADIFGGVRTGPTEAVLQLQWAQLNSNVGDTKVLIGSWLSITRVIIP